MFLVLSLNLLSTPVKICVFYCNLTLSLTEMESKYTLMFLLFLFSTHLVRGNVSSYTDGFFYYEVKIY